MNIYWDTAKDTLYIVVSRKQNYFCTLRPHNRHWIIEYNDPPTTATVYASSAALNNTSNTISPSNRIENPEKPYPLAASGAASQPKTFEPKTFEISPTHLHQIIGYTGAEAISKLPSAIDGLKLTTPYAQDEFRSCEVYRLSKAHQIISRSSNPEIPSIRPLQRVAYNLIPIEQGFNNHY